MTMIREDVKYYFANFVSKGGTPPPTPRCWPPLRQWVEQQDRHDWVDDFNDDDDDDDVDEDDNDVDEDDNDEWPPLLQWVEQQAHLLPQFQPQLQPLYISSKLLTSNF